MFIFRKGEWGPYAGADFLLCIVTEAEIGGKIICSLNFYLKTFGSV